MSVNEGREAHDHALNALSYLLNEPWTFEVLGLVRYELGQAYFMLKKHLKDGICMCGHEAEDLALFKSLLIDVNVAISHSTLSPIPRVVDDLKLYFSNRKMSHHCIHYTLNKHEMTYDI